MHPHHTASPTPPRGRPRKKKIEEALDLVYRRRWVVVATFLTVAALTVAYVLQQPTLYRTSATVLVDLNRAGSDTPINVAADPFSRNARSVATELFVLQRSLGIRGRVAERMGETPDLSNVSFTQASRDVPSGIAITAVSPDPERAAALANAYAEEYVEQTQIGSRTYLTAQRELLQEQADRLRAELNETEGEVAGTMASAGQASLGASALYGQLSNLRASRDEARIALQTSQNRLASINSQLADITPRLADRMSSGTERRVASIREQITQLETEKLPYERQLANGRDDAQTRRAVAQLDRRIADLQRELDGLSTQFTREVMDAGGIAAPEAALGYVSDLKGQAAQEQIEISGLQGRIAQLNRRIGELEGQVSRVPGATTSLSRATRDRDQVANMYQSVVQQLQQIQIQEESEPGYAQVLRGAPVPAFPEGDSPLKTIGFGLLLGLALGLGLAVARDRVDNRVHKPEHVAALGVPVLEAVPDLKKLIKDEFDGVSTVELGGRPVASELVTAHAPLSPASEAYRHLRTAVQFSRPETLVRTVVVTSGGAGEGKSTTASNLAVTFAQSGRRTVLIDTDFRRPRLHETFGAPPQPGLVQALRAGVAGKENLEAWLDASFATGVEGLYVVPTGGVAVESEADAPGDGRAVVANPAELLGSPEARAFLDGLREVVDIVVIDTPPVLAATDAVLLSTQADATIVVASAGKTKAGDVEHALAHLDDVGAKVVGAVLNRFTLENALGYAYTYGHYSRYGPYSKYGHYEEKGERRRRKRRPTGTTDAA
jgi:tyrosine-protein kinase Etk/Wzc